MRAEPAVTKMDSGLPMTGTLQQSITTPRLTNIVQTPSFSRVSSLAAVNQFRLGVQLAGRRSLATI
jgi:hypothetical protein